MPVQYGGDKITFGDGSTVGSGWAGFKNRLINSDMRIDQRNAGASMTLTGSLSQYGVDRFAYNSSQASKLTAQQSTTVPVGFYNSNVITVSSAATIGSGDYFTMFQHIEANNVSDLNFGSSNAKTVTLSFWVRSSVTGTFVVGLLNASINRSYLATYTISAANTWEQKSITIAGDTTGTWTAGGNGTGITVRFDLGSGSGGMGTANAWQAGNLWSVSGSASSTFAAQSGATFYITGVQLEKGSTATSFDYRPYGTELALCQRYYYKSPQTAPGEIFTVYQTNAGIVGTTCFPVTMRTTPTMTYGYSTPYSGNTFYEIASGAVTTWTLTDARASSSRVIYVYDVTKSGLTLGNGYSSYLTASAEL